jgi:signal transduction histidine kinase
VALSIVAALDRRDAVLRLLEAKHAQVAGEAQAKSRLLMNVSHEIRTPLNVIQGYAELLMQMEALSPRQREVIENMAGAASQLQALANDLLDTARAERGALALRPAEVDVGPLLHTAAADARRLPEGEAATLRIGAQAGLTLWADPLRARQIVQNLLSNAIKYAGAAGPIAVRAQRRDAMVRIEVIDHGPGLPPTMRGAEFEPFVNPARRRGAGVQGGKLDGVGVGLSLVKLLAEAQGGSVGVASTPHIETRFWVDLPAEAPPASEAGPTDGETEIDPTTVFGRP